MAGYLPPSGSPEMAVLVAAVAIARSAPAKRAEYVHAALIPWSKVENLRAALDLAGIEWAD